MNNQFSIAELKISSSLLKVLEDFSCGVKAMDEILHSQTLLSELHTDSPVAYGVYTSEGKLVGFCIVGVVGQQFSLGEETLCVDMVDVACLAVHKDYQYRGIGTAILDMISAKADEFVPEATFLHVEALDIDDGSYSAVRFYEKYGFRYGGRAGVDAARMFYMLSSL